MDYLAKNASKSKRQRTTAQLERKRMVDREHQRARCSQNQAEIRQMKDRIQELQGRLRRTEALLQHLPVRNQQDNLAILRSTESHTVTQISPHSAMDMNSPGQTMVDTPDHPHSLIHPALPLAMHVPSRGTNISPGPNQLESSSSQNTTQPPSHPMAIPAVILKDPECIHEGVPGRRHSAQTTGQIGATVSNTIDPFCLCGRGIHSSHSECFEQNVAQAVVEASFSPGDAVIPRRPTLADLCLIGEGSNQVSRLVITYLRKPNPVKVSDLFGMFIGMYILLRYRLRPSLETYNDIPPFLQPTKVQDSCPHPISVDFFPYPQIRDVLALQLYQYDKTDPDNDLPGVLTCNWPPGKELLVREGISIILNPEYEPHIRVYENWQMSAAWASKHPRLAPLANIVS